MFPWGWRGYMTRGSCNSCRGNIVRVNEEREYRCGKSLMSFVCPVVFSHLVCLGGVLMYDSVEVQSGTKARFNCTKYAELIATRTSWVICRSVPIHPSKDGNAKVLRSLSALPVQTRLPGKPTRHKGYLP